MRDVYSKNHSTPKRDQNENISLIGESKYDSSSKKVSMETRRKLDTGDQGDYLIQVGEDIAMSYAFKKQSAWGAKHEKWDVWTLKVTDNGVTDGSLDLT